MTAMPRLSRSGIEYGTHCWNFYPGCLHKPRGICPVPRCWAEDMSKRQKQDFHNPHLIPARLLAPLSRKKSSRILVNFMGDLFGDWVDPEKKMESTLPSGIGTINMSLRGWVLTTIKQCPQHTFVFLTKNPKGLLKWSPFPDNCSVGFSACNREMLLAGCRMMRAVEARVQFVSIEPMLEDTWCLPSTPVLAGIKWVIIGAQTKPSRPPEAAWIETMIEVADTAGAKVFLKNNLAPLLNPVNLQKLGISMAPFYTEDLKLRQELPR